MTPSGLKPDPVDGEQFSGATGDELSKDSRFLHCGPAFSLRPEMAHLAVSRGRGAKAGRDNLGSTQSGIAT
jgi:hypothetical protein